MNPLNPLYILLLVCSVHCFMAFLWPAYQYSHIVLQYPRRKNVLAVRSKWSQVYLVLFLLGVRVIPT